MAETKAPFSRYGLARGAAVDVEALSLKARYQVRTFRIAGTVFTASTTTKHSLGPVGVAGTVRAAYLSTRIVPAGGTLTAGLVAYDASGNAEIVLTDTTDPETLTAREARALTLASTNVALAAEDTLELHAIAGSGAISPDATDMHVTVLFEVTEADPPTR